ncbi:grasp-with-spasm system ATP-grasp peptide maturase [Chryseobacterium sp. SIMBA_029]|uniref:grasp-with-spasm system ATP-grasp peptide maturase n=1 Tax=Chryseobacterium sp. SIMBA_029 TaxID=3085772 RepID=UPI0039794805
MILILSRSDDGSTNRIIDWIFFQKKKYVRLNGNKANYEIVSIKPNEILVSINDMTINILEAESIWYRRSGVGQSSFDYSLSKELLKEIFKKEVDQFYIYNQIKNEFKVVFEYVHFLIHTHISKSLGNYFKKDINKLVTLFQAQQVGLKVPESYIFNTSRELENHQNLVTKALMDGVYYRGKDYDYYSYTERVSQSDTDIPPQFLPSLFQEEIKKKYELRIFYLKGKIYTSVIFSQQNKNASVDFRKEGHSVRYLPYNLPVEIQEKIITLMSNLDHDIGAIDMIVDIEDNYIFLEVNPGGQFSYYSDMCNFYLEKQIADLL